MWRLIAKGHKGILGGDEKRSILSVVVVPWVYTLVKICQILLLKWVHVCIFYLSTFGLKTNEVPISCCVEKSLPGSDRSSSQEPVAVGKGRNDGGLY